MLTTLTIKTGALTLSDLFNLMITFLTMLSTTPINPILLLKIPRIPVTVNKITQTTAARFDCQLQNLFNRLNQSFITRHTDSTSSYFGIDPR